MIVGDSPEKANVVAEESMEKNKAGEAETQSTVTCGGRGSSLYGLGKTENYSLEKKDAGL